MSILSLLGGDEPNTSSSEQANQNNSSSSSNLSISTTKIPQKEAKIIQKKSSPQRRRASDAIPIDSRPPSINASKLSEVREQLGEEKKTNHPLIAPQLSSTMSP
ncbi:20335_t:CDS:2, partial [Entrophospora sp. SA101]